MEALADFGTVDLLGVQALTSAIYRVWNGAFDEAAALQLASVLLTLHLRAARRRAAPARPRPLRPAARRGRRDRAEAAPRLAALARGAARAGSLLAVVFVLPVVQLVAWSVGDHRRRHRRAVAREGGAEHRAARGHHRAWSRSRSARVARVRRRVPPLAGRAGHDPAVDARLRGARRGRRGRGLRAAGLDRPPAHQRGRRRVRVADRAGVHRHDPRPGDRLPRAVQRARVPRRRLPHEPDRPQPRRRRPGAGRRPGPGPGRRPPARCSSPG